MHDLPLAQSRAWPRQRSQGTRLAPGNGSPRILSAAQERRVFVWINGKNPMQYGFDFGLWTRQTVSDLISQRFGVRLSLASVGTLLARQGLTPQNPCSVRISVTPTPLPVGSVTPTQPLPHKPSRKRPTSTSGTNRDFVPTRCTARPGTPRGTPGRVGARSALKDQRGLGDQC